MQYQQLGKSDLQISKISFGCMSLKPETPDSELILHKAIAVGINFFDTADLYDHGANEELLGRALKVSRKKVIIATKVGNQWRKDGSGWDWNPSKEYILSSVEKSLQRLQTDYIDLYQLHGGTINDPIDEIIEAFEKLKQQGNIRYYGISSIRQNVIREWVKRSNLVSVMMQYSLLDRRPEEEAFPLLLENNIGVLARGSLAQGLLIDKPAKTYLGYTEEEVLKARNALHSLSSSTRTPAQAAIQFVLDHPAVTSAVTGIRTMDQLREAIGTFGTITAEEMETLRKAIPINNYTEHR
ncbi:MAG TPA: aldo/keto reductase [Flavisolibacter sp.]|nr:aldo/keto reductase [Flavisolibacter sp.]